MTAKVFAEFLDWISTGFLDAAALAILVFLPFSFLHRTRRLAAVGFLACAVWFAFCSFVSAVVVVGSMWGWIWAALSVFAVGVPTYILAAIALVQHGMWTDLVGLAGMVIAAVLSALANILVKFSMERVAASKTVAADSSLRCATPYIDE